LPGRFFAAPVAPAFIFLAEKPLRSPLEMASPLFLNRFLPPKPNFSFFFCRLAEGPPPLSPRRRLRDCSALLASSMATSKGSSSSVGPDLSAFRSGQAVSKTVI